jgi:hypothetical protein
MVSIQPAPTGGLGRIAVTPQEMKEIEPTLAGKYYGGYFTESDLSPKVIVHRR